MEAQKLFEPKSGQTYFGIAKKIGSSFIIVGKFKTEKEAIAECRSFIALREEHGRRRIDFAIFKLIAEVRTEKPKTKLVRAR